MTDSGRILQASKVSGRFGEIMDGNLMLSNGSDKAPEAVSTHFEITIDFVDEWLGRNVEALIINNVCVRLSDRENDLVYPEATAIPSMEAAEETDEAPIAEADEHDEVSAEAPVMEVVESEEEEEADEVLEVHAEADEEEEAGVEVPAIAAFELSRQASLLETAESEAEEAPASQEPLEVPSYSAQIEPAEEKRIVWPPFEDEEEEEETPAETSSHSYALSQPGSEPRTDDYRSGETELFRF